MQRRYLQLQRHYISVNGHTNLVAEDDSQLATNTQEKVSPRVLALEISADHWERSESVFANKEENSERFVIPSE